MSDKVFLGNLVGDFEKSEPLRKISRVNIVVDSETMVTAGDDSGRTIEVTNPWATQAMANELLARLRDVDYKPYSATNALIDPAAEIGDGVTVAGIYAPLDVLNTTFDAACVAQIGAPEGDEIDDEYPYTAKNDRDITRKIAYTRSLITKTANDITLRVESLDKAYSEVKVTLDGVTVTDQSGTTKIKGSSIETKTLYVDAANISGTLTAVTVDSSTIKGSTFASLLDANGNVGGEIKMQYLYDGWVAGGIRLDDQGAGTADESRHRMYVYTDTVLGTPFALKLKSAGNMSISSDSSVFIKSGQIHLNGTVYINGVPLNIA